jgi:hypothetical protein
VEMLSSTLSRRLFSEPVRSLVIVGVPLAGFLIEKDLGLLTDAFGPALYTSYALGIAAYASLVVSRMPPAVSSIAAGVFGAGAGLFVLVALSFVGLAALSLLSSRSLIFLGFFIVVVFPVIVTAIILVVFLIRTLQASAIRQGHAETAAWSSIGCLLALIAMIAAQAADAAWMAPRLRSFEGNDIAEWEQSLSDIRSNVFCSERRCRRRVCDVLNTRFGDAAAGGLRMPAKFDAPFEKVYGASSSTLCQSDD